MQFLAKFEASGVPKTFVKRDKPKKVKIKSMFLWYMFPPQILRLEWRIISMWTSLSIEINMFEEFVAVSATNCNNYMITIGLNKQII